MALPSERAVDLRPAYRICEVTPLEGEDLRYYVQLAAIRKSESMNNISTMLEVQESGEFSSLLYKRVNYNSTRFVNLDLLLSNIIFYPK